MKALLLLLGVACLACGDPHKVAEATPSSAPSEEPAVPAELTAEASASGVPEPEPLKEVVLSEFTTRFKAGTTVTDGRVRNITLVAEHLKNLVLRPGDEFSFNKTVGPRTLENGFQNAPTYFAGEILEGVGGGTCQVSSTLFAAVLYAGVDVTDRHPHSRKSSYIEAGLDAAVNYPESCQKEDDPTICYDLRFKNAFSYPIHIEAEVGTELGLDGKRSLTVRVLGVSEAPKVVSTWAAWSTPPFEVRHRKVAYWKDDRSRLKQPGQVGLEGARTVVLTWPDGHEIRRKVISRYQPVPEVWEVGQEWKEP